MEFWARAWRRVAAERRRGDEDFEPRMEVNGEGTLEVRMALG